MLSTPTYLLQTPIGFAGNFPLVSLSPVTATAPYRLLQPLVVVPLVITASVLVPLATVPPVSTRGRGGDPQRPDTMQGARPDQDNIGIDGGSVYPTDVNNRSDGETRIVPYHGGQTVLEVIYKSDTTR